MSITELRDLFDECGYGRALAVLEDAGLPGADEYALQEQLEAWEAEKMRRWTRPARAGAFNPHEF